MKKIISVFMAASVSMFSLSSSCFAENSRTIEKTEIEPSTNVDETKKSKSVPANNKSDSKWDKAVDKIKFILFWAPILASLSGIYTILLDLMDFHSDAKLAGRNAAYRDVQLINNRCVTVVPPNYCENQDSDKHIISKFELLQKLAPDRIGNECFGKIENLYNELNETVLQKSYKMNIWRSNLTDN